MRNAGSSRRPGDDPGGLQGDLRLLGRNWRVLLRDVVVVAAWATALVAVFVALDGPRWLFDLALVGGIVAYTLTRGALETTDG